MSDVIVTNTVLPSVSWQPLSVCSYNDPVAVFRFRVVSSSLPDNQQTELQPHEISQAQRYHRQEDRNRYIYTRRMVRILVGHYINQEPSEIEFTLGINKKPEINGNTSWHLNVSHSGDCIVVAIGNASVGVDTERINPDFMFQDMLFQSFSQPEQAYIKASHDSRFAFYDLWTRKEALVKATAKGLDDDFQHIPSLNGIHPIGSDLIGASGNWTVTSFMVFDEYPAAVAHRPIAELPTFYTLDHSVFG
ncbi:4'-phosphopantetheinyl transferase family protein [Spirosoma arboris]|nr:4'-phosphopantetheinyl transferase superfamily protein [Spirosoma arboris]